MLSNTLIPWSLLLAHGILALAAGGLFLTDRRSALMLVISILMSLLAGMWIMGHAYHLSTSTGLFHFLSDIVGALLLGGWLGFNMLPLLFALLWRRTRPRIHDLKGAIVSMILVTLAVLFLLLPVNGVLVLLFSLE